MREGEDLRQVCRQGCGFCCCRRGGILRFCFCCCHFIAGRVGPHTGLRKLYGTTGGRVKSLRARSGGTSPRNGCSIVLGCIGRPMRRRGSVNSWRRTRCGRLPEVTTVFGG